MTQIVAGQTRHYNIDQCIDGYMDGSTDGWGWMAGWLDGWMDGWMNGWMDGWMDGCSEQRIMKVDNCIENIVLYLLILESTVTIQNVLHQFLI